MRRATAAPTRATTPPAMFLLALEALEEVLAAAEVLTVEEPVDLGVVEVPVPEDGEPVVVPTGVVVAPGVEATELPEGREPDAEGTPEADWPMQPESELGWTVNDPL